jgi:RNA polymerase sigma-70 factor, ECF subfamily
MNRNSYSNFQDQELLILFQEGSEEAFNEIYQRYRASLYLHALKMLKDRDEAQDVIQEVFTKLWHKGDTLVLSTSLSSYLYTAVRNRILDIFSHEKLVAKHQESLQAFIDKGEFITDNLIREKELASVIEREIAELPPKMREVFELSRKGHLSYAEIAEDLNIAENTVRKQISKALKRLKPRLADFLLVVFIPLAALLGAIMK